MRVSVRVEGEGEFKGRAKAYGNITLPQLSITRFSFHRNCVRLRTKPVEKKSVQDLRKTGNQ